MSWFRRWQYPGYIEALRDLPESVTLDKWFVRALEPVRLPPPVLEGGSYFVDITVPAPPLSWYQPASEPVRLPPPVLEGGLAFIEFTTQYDPAQDFWYPESNLPIFPIPPYPEGGLSFVWKPPAVIIPDMCTWFMPTEQPYLIRQPNVAVGQQILTEFSVPTEAGGHPMLIHGF